jgi:hypothetical protein
VRLLVVRVAVPLPSRLTFPRLVAPSRKVTLPDGVPETAETVAVNVTLLPSTDGLGSDTKIVLVATRTAAVPNVPVAWSKVKIVPPTVPVHSPKPLLVRLPVP